MELKTDTLELWDDVTLSVTQLPPIRAFELIPQLGGIVVPLLESGVGGGENILKLMPYLLGMEGKKLTALMMELFSSARVQFGTEKLVALNSKDAVNKVFAGRLPKMIRAIAFAAIVNFKDFIGDNSGSEATDESSKVSASA